MKSDDKTKEQLLKEIDLLKAKIAGLEKSEIKHKRVEEALRETEQNYRNLFNTCRDGVAITTLDGELINVNQAYQEMLGYTLKELKGINFQKLTPKKWNKPEADGIKNFMAKGYGTFEKEYIRKDGTIFPISLTTWLIKDTQGNPAGIGAFVKDITEYKRAEEALRKSEVRVRTIYENAPVLIDAFDENGRCVLWNKQCSKIFGWTIDEINAHDDTLAVFYPDPAVRDEVRRTVTTDPEGRFREWHPVTKDGETLTTMWANFHLPDGIVFNLGYDITERKQMEEKLRESAVYLDIMGDALMILDSEARVVKVNKSFSELWGYSPDEAVGKPVFEMFPEGELPKHQSEMERAVKEGGVTIFETIALTNKNKEIEVSVSGTALKDEKGMLLNFIALFRDITERKQMEEQLKKSLKEKEILIKEIFHRVKNNLAVVSGLLNIQAANIKDKKAKAAFQETRDRIFSLSAVHSQLYHTENYSIVDYKEYIKNLVSNIFYSSQMSGHVKLHLDLDDITLPIDKAIPCGLLLNEIVTNALKHAFPEKRKGNLRIITHSFEDKNIEIIVKDDGIGIPESFNIEKTETLGLKLIDLMTKQIEGTLEIESKKGTEFRIRLSTEPGQVIR
jgi:PAS domain S-box-containing protein